MDPGIAQLIARLASEDPVERTVAAKEIARRGAEGREAVPALQERLADDEALVRAMAAAALGKIGASAASARAALCDLLHDTVFPVRFWAADALGRLGASAREALDDLERARTADENKAVRGAATLAIARIHEDSTVG